MGWGEGGGNDGVREGSFEEPPVTGNLQFDHWGYSEAVSIGMPVVMPAERPVRCSGIGDLG